MMEKILIVGGCGFIGKNIIEYLDSKYKIIIIDKNIDTFFLSKYKFISSYQYDFTDIPKLNEILNKENPDYVINLVSIVTAERELNLFPSLIDSNLNVLLQLFGFFKKSKSLKLFIQFGSAEEYGNAAAPYNEQMKEQPDSPYALVKLLTTNTCMMLYRNYCFPVVVVAQVIFLENINPEPS